MNFFTDKKMNHVIGTYNKKDKKKIKIMKIKKMKMELKMERK